MNQNKCYICTTDIDHPSRGGFVQVDEPNIKAGICRECNTELNGKVALIAEYQGMRTGEVIFITRKVLNMVAKDVFPNIFSVYVIPPDTIKILISRIMHSHE